MDHSSENFFALLRYALGTRKDCPVLTLAEWQEAYATGQRQGLVPFIGDALTRAGHVLKDDTPDNERAFSRLIMRWTAEVMRCEAANRQVSAHAVAVARRFERAGFACCLLKGQGNALLYPNPFARTPGDIDMWLRASGDVEADSRRIIALARRMSPGAGAFYHHVECPPFRGTPVEAHYRPQFLFSPLHNIRLQRFFATGADAQFAHKVMWGEGVVAVPTPAFNVVFQLSHIFNHLFHEGIGLRQLLDYYYVLQHLENEACGQDWSPVLAPLGLRGMAGAVMWILVSAFGMDAARCIVPEDERRGRFVLNEILQGGNFGKYDPRDHFGRGQLGRNLQRLWRDMRLLRYFPVEALGEPFFRLWHFFWRLRHRG